MVVDSPQVYGQDHKQECQLGSLETVALMNRWTICGCVKDSHLCGCRESCFL